jgi:hypothetical protein
MLLKAPKKVEELTRRERFTFAGAAFVAASSIGLGNWKNPYVQYYLHRFDPWETVVIVAATFGAFFVMGCYIVMIRESHEP